MQIPLLDYFIESIGIDLVSRLGFMVETSARLGQSSVSYDIRSLALRMGLSFQRRTKGAIDLPLELTKCGGIKWRSCVVSGIVSGINLCAQTAYIKPRMRDFEDNGTWFIIVADLVASDGALNRLEEVSLVKSLDDATPCRAVTVGNKAYFTWRGTVDYSSYRSRMLKVAEICSFKQV